MSPTPARSFPLASNSAGAPLPLIPRRSSTRSSNTPASNSVSGSPPRSSPPLTIVVHDPSPSKEPLKGSTESDASSSNSSTVFNGITPRVKKNRKSSRSVPTLCPPEQSTPIPAVFNASTNNRTLSPEVGDDATPRASTSKPLIYQPGVPLRISLDGIKNWSLSESRIDGLPGTSSQSSSSFQIPKAVEAQLVRKKSGQLVKSSLKRSKSIERGSLSVFTSPTSSKSEPTTPKAVHFDAQLEHVKLFLAEQKPLAVSRDGSPTDDTSGTESDFPSFIYGSAEERNARRNLTMQVTNMPIMVNPNHDVALEGLKLSPDMLSIEGRVRLRNLAYHKQLAVRFTFDAWQTTSEVVGKYLESINKDFDRFTFSIRLNDLLARIDGKTLLLALRYNVEGREIWDNNSCQNYRVIFSTKKDSASASDVADLKTRLENIAKGREAALATPTPRLSRRSGSRSNSSSSSSSENDKPLEFKTSASLASRYDLGSSLRSPWKPPAPTFSPPPPPRHLRTRSHPAPSSAPTSSIPWPEKIITTPAVTKFPSKTKAELGSPRDLSDDDHFRIVGSPRAHMSDMENVPFPIIQQSVDVNDQRPARNHKRGGGGYFDVGVNFETGVKRTPPGSPKSSSPLSLAVDHVSPLSSSRSISFPPADGTLPRTLFPAAKAIDIAPRQSLKVDIGGDSEESTPTFTSSGSSRSATPSPTENFTFAALAGAFGDPLSQDPSVDYHQLIDKFCFYTGSDNTTLVPRPASVSSFDEFFTSQSPRLHGFSHMFGSPPLTARSNSDDAIVCRSGSSTPTAHRTPTPESRSATPIAA